jgi:glutamine synthetase
VVLHKPGKNPKTNLQFLTFVVNTIKCVFDHQDLLRASVASASNAHRLGANEAPPAILSCFLGSEVSAMLDQIEEQVTSKKMTPDEKTALKLDIGKIPEILLDNTDRNRTSPFAFTGNRFEFRAVGGSCNPATPMTILNAALAGQLIEFKKQVDKLINGGVKKDEAIFQVIREYIIASKAIRFEGDNYSEDWVKEAKKRGLTNVTDVPEALSAYLTERSKKLFFDLGIFTEAELEGRVEVMFEQYTMKIQIEARVLGDLVINHIVPTAVKYQNTLMENVLNLKAIFGDGYEKLSGNRTELIKEISDHITIMKAGVNEMIEARKVANKLEDEREKARQYADTVAPFLNKIRYHIDKLELIVDDEIWPLPKYRELLFSS